MSFLSSLFSCCSGSIAKQHEKHFVDVDTRRPRRVTVADRSRDQSAYPFNDGETTHNPPPRYEDIPHNGPVLGVGDEKDRRVYAITEVRPRSAGCVGHPPPETDGHFESLRADYGSRIDGRDRRSRGTSPAPSVSDESSVISIPSTRLSGLTSTCTGQTCQTRVTRDGLTGASQRFSWRHSGEYAGSLDGTAPPSYYAESEVEHERDTEGLSHPVMAEDWLERLWRQAKRRTRENGRLNE